MSGMHYTLVAYAVGLGLMLGYGLLLWLEGHSVSRRQRVKGD